MAIEFAGATPADVLAGDLLLSFAASSVTPGPPISGYTHLYTGPSQSGQYNDVCYKIAEADGEALPSGFFRVTIAYRNARVGAESATVGVFNPSSTTVTYPALTTSVEDGTSWVVTYAYTYQSGTPALSAPAGEVKRAPQGTTWTNHFISDTNGGVLGVPTTATPTFNGTSSVIRFEIIDTSAELEGQVMAFDGSSFNKKPVKVWSGSSWIVKPAKHWDGTDWARTN